MFERPASEEAHEGTLTAGEARPFDRKTARLSGYTGDPCTNCGSMQVKRNGSCLVCEGCGTTTGCS
jgi:ribonucleoside-diphosphate reductase alpha chain